MVLRLCDIIVQYFVNNSDRFLIDPELSMTDLCSQHAETGVLLRFKLMLLWIRVLGEREEFKESKVEIRELSFESPHPYPDSSDVVHKISVPGALRLEIVFDPQCRTEGGYDCVRFVLPDGRTVGDDKYTGRDDSAHWAGVGSTAALVIEGSEVEARFHSDGSENDWGYKFTAEGFGFVAASPSSIYRYCEATFCFDLSLICSSSDSPETKSIPSKLQPGDRVQRGPDWIWGDQDGGSGNFGTVTEVQGNAWVKVQWDSPLSHSGASAPAARALPVILRVRGPGSHRVRLERSLKSDHVGTLQSGVAFAFSHVGEGWAKLSPMHYSDLQTSRDRCDISDFKPHNLEKNGYCITSVDGRDIFDEPNEEQKADVLARYSKFQSETPADSAAASCSAAPAVAQELPARWTWPSDRPPSNVYSDDGECINMTMYASLAVPLLQSRDSRLHWARFLRCALYFAYATSAPQQCSKRTLLLQVFMFTVMNSRALARNITVGVVAGS